MDTALAVRSDLDPVKIVRTMGGEYTGALTNVKYILKSVKSVISKEDYYHIKRILTGRLESRSAFIVVFSHWGGGISKCVHNCAPCLKALNGILSR